MKIRIALCAAVASSHDVKLFGVSAPALSLVSTFPETVLVVALFAAPAPSSVTLIAPTGVTTIAEASLSATLAETPLTTTEP